MEADTVGADVAPDIEIASHSGLSDPDASRALEPATPLMRDADPSGVIGEILEGARTFVGADAAFVSEFRDQRQVFRWVNGDADSFGLRIGGSVPLARSYCRELITGRLSGTIPDTRHDAVAQILDVTMREGIGAYVAAPIVRRDGSLFGTLCAISHEAHPGLDERHGRFLSFLARLVSDHVTRIGVDDGHHLAIVHKVRSTLDDIGAIRVALQPIVNLGSAEVFGEEALARFGDGGSPDRWFGDAWEAGLGKELELAAVRAAWPMAETIPEHAFLALNVSPETIMSPRLEEAWGDVDPHRIVLEITEHRHVKDYAELCRALRPLRKRGVRLAVDDAGAGFASLNHILALSPDIIKLDVSLTGGIDHDSARQALASSLMAFAARIGATVVAEGIETLRELEALQILGIRYGQGFLLGAPRATTESAP